MRRVVLLLLVLTGCYREHARERVRPDAPAVTDAPAATDVAVDASRCGGATEVSLLLVRSLGAGTFLDLTSSAVVGFGDCGSGALVLGFDTGGPRHETPAIVVTIPVESDAPIDREGDWACTVRAQFGAEIFEDDCTLTGRITGDPYDGFYLQLSGMLGGIGYSAGGRFTVPVCELHPCI